MAALQALIILALSQILLFVLFTIFILPRSKLTQPIKKTISHFYHLRFPLFIIILVVLIHLIEVNFLDQFFTTIIQSDFTPVITNIELDIVTRFSTTWNTTSIFFFVFIYIILYPFTLWYTPLYTILTNQRKPLETLAFSLIFVYILALPFYLFFPVTNVYTHYELPSALNTAIPQIETFFYSTTTQNNCFPSLHTAMSIIIAYTIFLTDNKRFQYIGMFMMVTVIISVLYLSIHWILDVIGGIIVALLAILLSKTIMNRMNHHG